MIKNQEPKRIHKSTYYKVETDNMMCLRMYFCLPVPEKQMKDSWITNPVVMEYGGLDS